MAGFAFRKNLDGSAHVPTTLSIIGANSMVVQKGDLIRINTAGFATLIVAVGSQDVAGVVVSVVDKNDSGIPFDAGSNDIWTLSSDNQTVAKYKVKFIPALPNYLFYNDADDTLTEAMLFKHFDVNDENDVDVATASDTPTTGLVRLIEVDPDGDGDASKGLFQILTPQLGSFTPSGRAA